MRRIVFFLLLAAGLRLFGLLPFESHDVATLQPIRALVVSLDGCEIVLDGGVCQGRGKTVEKALSDLFESGEGTVFLRTASHVVLSGKAQSLLYDLVESRALRPAAVVVASAGTPPDPETAANYLDAHSRGVTVGEVGAAMVRKEPVRLPLLVETKGGLRLYG